MATSFTASCLDGLTRTQLLYLNHNMCSACLFQDTQLSVPTAATRKTLSTSSAPGSKSSTTTVKVNRTHSESIVNGDKLSPWHVSQSGEKKVERKVALTTEL